MNANTHTVPIDLWAGFREDRRRRAAERAARGEPDFYANAAGVVVEPEQIDCIDEDAERRDDPDGAKLLARLIASIITRDEARERGLKRFFTGKLCRNGHVAERYVSDGKCVECKREADRRHYAAHREEVREQQRQWRAANADYDRERCRRWRKANPKELDR